MYNDFDERNHALTLDNITTGGNNCGSSGFSGGLTAPIPEPETYEMMLAGLGLMDFVARRRKQQAAAETRSAVNYTDPAAAGFVFCAD